MSILYIRKVFQMTVISLILVVLTTVIVIFAIIGCGASDSTLTVCVPFDVSYAISDSSVTVSWNHIPCATAVNISHYVNGDINFNFPFPIQLTAFAFERHSCSQNVFTFQAVLITGAIGTVDDEILNFDAGIIGDGKIQDLNFNEATGHFEWTPPDHSEDCNIEYQINFKNDITEQKAITTTNEFFDIDVYPCSVNNIEIATLIRFDDTASEAVSSSYNGPIRRNELIHVRTNPGVDGAEITWKVQDETNFCTAENLLVEVVEQISDEDSTFSISFKNEQYVDYTLHDLEPNTYYRYRVCYVFADTATENVCSANVRFLTDPIVEPSIVDIITDSNGISIYWQQQNNVDFISGYIVRVEPEGPIHFVPNYCVFDLTVYEEEIEAEVQSYTISDAKPSFKYILSVITVFSSLGMTSQSAYETVSTDEYVPGELTLATSYDYIPASLYNVNLAVEWDVPCDVNGRVRNFVYKLTGTLNSELTSMCSDITFTSGSIDAEDQETYTFQVFNIIPFFQYTVEVVTNLEDHSGPNSKTLQNLPAAYTGNT